MTLTRKKPRTWLCPLCGHRNELRTSSRKCQGCKQTTKPLPRIPKHKRTLRAMTYEQYAELNERIHGSAVLEVAERDGFACGVCGKLPSEGRKLDRDHNHRTGDARGLACGGNHGCNVLMLPWITAATARGIADAKRAAGESDAERWSLIAAYLERVEAHYGRT